MYAAISPRDNSVALFCDDGSVSALNEQGSRLKPIPAERYFARHSDTSIVHVHSTSEAIHALATHREMSLCLDMTLLLFDREVSQTTRADLAMELDRLFRKDENREYVLDLILSRPLPPDASGAEASALVQGHGVLRDVIEAICASQTTARVVFNGWLSIRDMSIVTQNGANEAFAILSRHGVFRRLAIEAKDRESLRMVTSKLALDHALKRDLDAAPRIMKELEKEVRPHLPNVERAKERSVPAAKHVRVLDGAPFDGAMPKHESSHAAFLAAVSQVERISDLYRQLKDQQADSMLAELVGEQLKHDHGEEHVVKSLCNVANRVYAYGRPKIAFECLTKALGFPNGIDAQLYFQIGNGLRESGHFDQAVNCYDRARDLDDGSLSDQIRLAIIRVTVAMGRYEDALSAYLGIPDLEFRPMELSGVGTLYRKMGRPRDAREAYLAAIEVADDFHSAHAGLAEVKKQLAMPHDAIAKYNTVLRRFTEIEEGARKVYELSRSHLFRITKQYDKSEAILRELATRFPGDHGVHTQFAQLLALRGRMKEACEHFRKARGTSLYNLGRLVCAAVSGEFKIERDDSSVADVRKSLLPEERGLASCAEAYSLIVETDYLRAQSELRDACFVDRLTRDLAAVLRYHAGHGVAGNLTYKSDYELCRIAKRSDQSLRNAIQAIAGGKYGDAIEFEREFLLRIAA